MESFSKNNWLPSVGKERIKYHGELRRKLQAWFSEFHAIFYTDEGERQVRQYEVIRDAAGTNISERRMQRHKGDSTKASTCCNVLILFRPLSKN